jgi:hypothetical protein
MFHTAGPAVRGALATLAALALVAALGACSDEGSDSEDAARPAGTEEAAPGIPTTATIGKVSGRLERKSRARLRRQVTHAVDRWIDAAYVTGDYPRSDFGDAFQVFSKDAAALARRDKRLMSNAALGDRIDTVTATARKLWIDVLATQGRAVGVTGRFVLVLDLDGEVHRTDRIAGRLFLSQQRGWQVFGYDVKRGRVA